MIKNSIDKTMEKMMFKIAKHYANVACPMILYQPKMTKSVKKLRKMQEEVQWQQVEQAVLVH